MTPEEFEQLVAQKSDVSQILNQVAGTANTSATMSLGGTEIIFLSIVLPITHYIIKEIGLPWLSEVKNYSELWRSKVNLWIDEQYRQQGIDQNQAKIVGEELRKQLEATTDPQLRSSWEKLFELVGKD
jgi:hypothetical protein